MSVQIVFWGIVIGLESVGRSQLWWADGVALLFMFFGITAGVAGFVLRVQRRPGTVGAVIGGIVSVLLVLGGNAAAKAVRMQVFADLAERSDDLIVAVEAYCHRFDRPPERIANLVPDILSVVPRTGLPAYPDFEMLPIRDGATRADWGIVVHCTIGVSSSDIFVYWPSEMYPDSIDGGRVRRIGRWAYVAGM